MDHQLRRSFGHIPVQRLLTVVFSVLLFLSVASTVWLLISSANRIVSKVVADSASVTTAQATLEIERFLGTPAILGRSVENALRAGYIDLNDRDSITRFMFRLPQRNADYGVSGVYIANPEGDLTSIDAELRDGVTVWSSLHASAATSGMLNIHAVNEDGSTGRLQLVGKPYNATNRPWFKKALTSSDAVWTSVYKDASSGKPVLTWARAIRNAEGELIAVAGVDLLLSRIQQFLEQLPGSEKSTIMLTDSSGSLFGNGAVPQGETAASVDQLQPQQVLNYINEQHDGITSLNKQFEAQVTIDNHRGLLKVVPLTESSELAWRVGVFVPLSNYLSSPGNHLVRIIPLGLLTLFIVWITLQLFIRLMVKPLLRLKDAANKIADGQFDVLIDTSSSNEVGELASSIESMRSRLSESFADINRQKVRAETTLASITDGVITVGSEGNVEYMNHAALVQCGLSADEVEGRPLEQVFNARDTVSQELLDSSVVKTVIDNGAPFNCNLQMHDSTGQERTIEGQLCPLTIKADSPARGAVLVFSDVTEQAVLKSELERQASVDDLTGLMNRRQFEKHLHSKVASVGDSNIEHCLCYMDLDQFKVVNDTCGHVAGDELLRQIGQLLRNIVRQGDAIARLGGDEFAMLMDRCAVEQGSRITEKLLTTISDFRFVWEDRVFSIGISIGMVAIDRHTVSATAVLADADTACYAAKDSGRNRIHVYRPDDSDLAERREELQLVNEIDSALVNGRFELFTQEIRPIDGLSNRLGHFEVLVRMHTSDGALVSPDRFLPIAEQFSLASKIDRWVVTSTLSYLEQNPYLLPMIDQCSINISGQSLGDEKFLEWLPAFLDDSPVPANKLCFEVTETSAIANLNNAIALIAALQTRGCTLALDDFGSGFSSLAYLKTLSFDYLKIDGMFVKDIMDDEQDLAMVKLINDIGKTMGMKTIAEFVETEAIRDQLAALGVEYVQGFAIDIPQPIDQLGIQPDNKAVANG